MVYSGDVARLVYFVGQGELEVLPPSGGSTPVGLLRVGSYFGEGGLLGEPYRVVLYNIFFFSSLF